MSHSRVRSHASRLAIARGIRRRTPEGISRPRLSDIHEVPDNETTEEMPENFSATGRRGTLRLPPLVSVVRK